MISDAAPRRGTASLERSEFDRHAVSLADQHSPLRRIAVLVPCYNEELTVANVVRGFRAALPDATIYVYDNNSTDATRRCAEEVGATVRLERRQGKGHVVRRMFADIDADLYLLV